MEQVRRWSQQYTASVPAPSSGRGPRGAAAGASGGPLPEALQLIAWLEAHIPADDAAPAHPAVCHGDYRLDNLVIDPATLQVGGRIQVGWGEG